MEDFFQEDSAEGKLILEEIPAPESLSEKENWDN